MVFLFLIPSRAQHQQCHRDGKVFLCINNQVWSLWDTQTNMFKIGFIGKFWDFLCPTFRVRNGMRFVLISYFTANEVKCVMRMFRWRSGWSLCTSKARVALRWRKTNSPSTISCCASCARRTISSRSSTRTASTFTCENNCSTHTFTIP